MKKFYLLVVLLVLVTIGIGKYYSTTYTNYDLNDDAVINSAKVTKCFDSGELEEVIFDVQTGNVLIPEIDDLSQYTIEKFSLLESIKEEMDSADIILTAKCTGGIRNLAGTCEQSVSVLEVIKGDNAIENKEIKVYSDATFYFDTEIDEIWVTSKINFMQEGKEYLIFLDETGHDDVYCVKNKYGVGYLCLEDTESIIVKNSNNLYYEEVRDSEFFVKDEEALKKLISLKKDTIDKYYNVEE